MPEGPRLFIVLQNQSIIQDLEILDLDWRELVDRRGVTAESAKLWLVFRRRLLEHVAMLGCRELVSGIFVAGGELRRAFHRFPVGKISDGIVALKSQTVLVDVNDFSGWRQNREGAQSTKIQKECFHKFVIFLICDAANYSWVMRWSADLALLLATTRLGAAFCLITVCATFVVGGLDETKGDDPTPMSPWNQAQSLALTACVSAIAAIDVMSIVFIDLYLWFSAQSDVFLPARLVYRRNSAIHQLRR